MVYYYVSGVTEIEQWCECGCDCLNEPLVEEFRNLRVEARSEYQAQELALCAVMNGTPGNVGGGCWLRCEVVPVPEDQVMRLIGAPELFASEGANG
jgi:hypothetical protein